MKAKKFWHVMSYVLVALLSAAIALSVVLGLDLVNRQKQSKLDALEELILDRFIGEADRIYMEDAAADAMVNALGDRWSYYVPADQVAALMEQKNNAYVGIGVTITVSEDETGLLITQVAAGGSAEEAGFLAGDVIVAVAGKPVAGQSLEEIKNQIRCEENTQGEITVGREGKQITSMGTR
ncbi:MAG: PDZ domain-containing protein, partial [Oscillospiraceae bacterium]|nr:PDZ domain-containing protein [Oscillospiraceae bacterium]